MAESDLQGYPKLSAKRPKLRVSSVPSGSTVSSSAAQRRQSVRLRAAVAPAAVGRRAVAAAAAKAFGTKVPPVCLRLVARASQLPSAPLPPVRFRPVQSGGRAPAFGPPGDGGPGSARPPIDVVGGSIEGTGLGVAPVPSTGPEAHAIPPRTNLRPQLKIIVRTRMFHVPTTGATLTQTRRWSSRGVGRTRHPWRHHLSVPAVPCHRPGSNFRSPTLANPLLCRRPLARQ